MINESMNENGMLSDKFSGMDRHLSLGLRRLGLFPKTLMFLNIKNYEFRHQ